MRLAFAFVLSGCLQQQLPPEPPPEPPPTGGWTNPQGPVVGCESDAACPGAVCARDGNCYPADQVHAVHAKWTVDGGAATPASCANPDLFVSFSDSFGLSLGFAPVPCRTGQFTVDKLPKPYDSVYLGADGEDLGVSAPIDPETGDALLDL